MASKKTMQGAIDKFFSNADYEANAQQAHQAQNDQDTQKARPAHKGQDAQHTQSDFSTETRKAERIHFFIPADQIEYLRTMSAAHGLSMAGYVSALIAADQERNADAYAQAKSFFATMQSAKR